MAIVVEDGTQVAGANSYVSLADARLILADYGQDLDVVDATAEEQLFFGMSYIEQFRSEYTGSKKTKEQAAQWPRFSAYLDGWLIDSNTIPQELINSQVFAAYEVAQGANLEPNDSGRKIASESVTSGLNRSYFKSSATAKSVVYKRVMNELDPLLSQNKNLKLLRT